MARRSGPWGLCINTGRSTAVETCTAAVNVARYIGTTPEAVTRLYTVPDRDAPALRILRNSEEGCVFLDGNLCMIYEVRPKTCRDFPYVAIGTHLLGGRQSSHARWAALCPIIFNALESYKHLTGYHPHSVCSTSSSASVCTTTPPPGDQPA